MAKIEQIAQCNVAIAAHQYPIVVTRYGLEQAVWLQSHVSGKQVLIVSNQTIAPLYLTMVQESLAAYQCNTVILPDGEQYKNQHSLNVIYDALIEHKHHRDSTIVALGGGVIGDIAGFAAATYQRGVGLVQIPTTLLAQIDASIGGKTAINHPLGKNLIGSFYQPQAVLIDVNTLSTLPAREFKAGLGEMIKYGLLMGGSFLTTLHEALLQGLNLQSPQLANLIVSCCQYKASLVAADERETGQRALLNLGHTFAHALETITNYQVWLHGEAVAIGLYCAAVLSKQLGLIDKQQVQLVEELIRLAGLPYTIPKTIDLQQLKTLMQLDKKIKDNCLRFIVFNKPGDCFIHDKVTQDILDKTLVNVVEGD